tara:strand:+ start:114 stop:1031 length:918 start_codon:yes stop_codon:yes gene_type:complete
MKKKIYLEGSSIKVLYPDIEFFLDKIRKNEPFKYLKVMHGTLDGITAVYKDKMDELNTLVANQDYVTIAKTISENRDARLQSGSDYWHGKDPQFDEKLVILWTMINQYKNLSSDIMIGLSLGVGLGNYWGCYEHSHPTQVSRRKIAGILDSNTYDSYLYGGVFKHFTIKNEIQYLFDVLNQLSYNVGFFGPTYFSRYKEVFGINDFTHMEIPVLGAIKNLDKEVDRIREFGRNSKTPTIVFLQCGHTMASNLIYNLKDENITIIDVGRSFDLLLKDEVDKHETMWRCWTSLDPNGLVDYVDKTRA